MIKCIQLTIKEHGYKALFRGLGYTLIRAAPVSATVLPLYELATEEIGHLL